MEVIIPIMEVTPWVRLSEEVLKDAILTFYSEENLGPVGVSEEAMQPWAEKMAFAAHKLVRRFRKLFDESPDSSRTEVLHDMKKLCVARKIPKRPAGFDEESSPDRPVASEEDLGQLPKVDWSMVLAKLQAKVDWPMVLEKLKDRQTAKTIAEPMPLDDEISEDEPEPPLLQNCSQLGGVASGPGCKRPVPTPARSDQWQLPRFVLDSLEEKKAPPPFATTGGAEDQVEDQVETHEAAAESEILAQDAGAKKPRKSRKKKKQPTALSGEDEAALAPQHQGNPSGAVPVQAGACPEGVEAQKKRTAAAVLSEGGEETYQPKMFSEKRKQFIAAERAAGLSYKDANKKWMSSNERVSLLMNVPMSELKKRRFV